MIERHFRAPNGDDQADPTEHDLDGIDLVIVAQLADDDIARRLAALNFSGTTVVDSAGAYAALTGRIPVRQVDSRWFIATGDFSSLATTDLSPRATIPGCGGRDPSPDLTSPLLLLAAIGILLSDGVPVLYRQQRLGRFGTALHPLQAAHHASQR